MAVSMLAKHYKYFISYSYLDEEGNIKFGNTFITVKCKLLYSSILKSVTEEIQSKQNIKEVVIIHFQLIGEYQ